MPTWNSLELVYNRAHNRPVISTAADDELRKVLRNQNASQTEIAIGAVNTQLRLWKEALEKAKADPVTLETLGFDASQLQFDSYIGASVTEDAQTILKGVQSETVAAELKNGIWSWYKLPYSVRRVGSTLLGTSDVREEDAVGPRKKAKVLENDELIDDIDEWVLRNEVFLRSLSKSHSTLPSVLAEWAFGLVRIKDLPKTLFNCSMVTSSNDSNLAHAIKVSRFPLVALPGYTILADSRRDAVFIQPNASEFKRRFGSMTGGLLNGLDWNNIFVAGGLVLGTLLTPDVPPGVSLPANERRHLNLPSEFLSSDIDLYIYGLNVQAANEKIKHIADVYKSNLGSVDAPFLVVRNSQTITLYSEWPKRRVQIVLKLVKDPREVLLNFDLDICAAGFDGSEVWMLPRFVRAIETGTNVFTMDLINGHYLGDRKATRDKRVFKYAKRGYGIRIIPLHIGFLSPYQSGSSKAALDKISLGEELKYPPLVLDAIGEEARKWTQKVVDHYIKNGQKDVTFYWPEGLWPRVKGNDGKPVFSHAMLEGYGQIVSEPLGRSCLTGFTLLMRHVALWELERQGKIDIYEHIFAEDAYSNIGQVAYDDTPAYEWDETFNISDFKVSIDRFNEYEADTMSREWIERTAYNARKARALFKLPAVKRVTYASSISDALSPSNDLTIPVVTTGEFVKFANDLIEEALKESGLQEGTGPLTKVAAKEDSDEVLTLWHLDEVLNWQMIDRRIDEVRELLWAFHRANERLYPEPENRVDYLRTNISKRAIRTSEKDENHSFVRWVARQPHLKGTHVNGIYLLREDAELSDDEY